MRINRRKIIKNAVLAVFSLIIILILILGMLNSNFSNIKKYDKEDSVSKSSEYSKKASFYNEGANMQVVIERDGVANLGDFVFSISADKKLIANISFTYVSNKNDNSWFDGDAKIRDEIVKKGTILRDATIDAMLTNPSVAANDEEMRETIRKSLNKNLHNGKAEEIYFNKFIIQ